MSQIDENKRIDRVLFGSLFLAGLFGTQIGVPAAIAISGDSTTVWLSSAAEIFLFLTPASAVGVWLGKKVNLGPRLLRLLISKAPEGRGCLWKTLPPTLMIGLILGVIGYFLQNAIPRSALMPGLENPNILEWFLRCINAAITEEIFFRLGLMTLFVWVMRLIIKSPAAHAPSLWIGNMLAAILFAGAHLPQISFEVYGWSLFVPFVVMSCGTGMIMGWLYMRYGLISAMIAHFTIDLVVYVIPELVGAL